MKGINVFFIVLIGSLYAGISAVLLLLDVSPLSFPSIDLISILSLVLFACLCVAGMYTERLYIIILVFVMVGFPTAVNNFIPGPYLGSTGEIGASVVPIFTHIDIYLLLGIFRYASNRLDININASARPLVVIVGLMLISFIANVVDSKESQEWHLLVAGGFQFRYMILLFFIVGLIRNLRASDIAIGLSISIIFLLAESVVFTTLHRLPRLASGSLATNTFANIVAQFSLFLLLISHQYGKLSVLRFFLLFVVLLGILVVLMTETRMAVLAAVLVYLILWVFRRASASHFVGVVTILTLALFAVIYYDLHERLPGKYKIWQIVSPAQVKTIMSEEGALTTKVPWTPEASSIITRIQLYRTSFKMISDSPFWGIGAGKWNYLKKDFGFDVPILIDSHNGYLALLSQYGVFAGAGIILWLLIWPSTIFLQAIRRYGTEALPGIWLLGVISLGMAICELSNAGVFKQQVYAMLTFISIILISEHKKGK